MKYLTFFAAGEDRGLHPAVSPAGVSKSRYMAQLLYDTGHPVEIISPAWSKCGRWRRWKAFDCPLGDGITLHQLATFGTPVRWLTPLQWLYAAWQVFFFLLRRTRAGEPVLVYHSYYLSLPVLLARRIKKFRLLLEVEEIYQDIVPLPGPLRRWETAILHAADGYVFSTRAIGDRIGREEVPHMVVNGSYHCPDLPPRKPPEDGRIHCLYSGTFDPDKAGAYLAVEAAALLPAAYCLHISGFGTAEQTRALQEKIEAVRARTACGLVYEGFLDDAAYEALLQRCQIGLNTQTPDRRFSDTCFPSKILTYLTHGLQVVSAANRAITDSDVGGRLTYYDAQTPEAVARAVRQADPSGGAENVRFVQQLHTQACRRMTALLSSL